VNVLIIFIVGFFRRVAFACERTTFATASAAAAFFVFYFSYYNGGERAR